MTVHHSIYPNVKFAQLGLLHRTQNTFAGVAWSKAAGGSALVYIHDPALRAVLLGGQSKAAT